MPLKIAPAHILFPNVRRVFRRFGGGRLAARTLFLHAGSRRFLTERGRVVRNLITASCTGGFSGEWPDRILPAYSRLSWNCHHPRVRTREPIIEMHFSVVGRRDTVFNRWFFPAGITILSDLPLSFSDDTSEKRYRANTNQRICRLRAITSFLLGFTIRSVRKLTLLNHFRDEGLNWYHVLRVLIGIMQKIILFKFLRNFF